MNDNRDHGIDLLRGIAAVAVVIIHCITSSMMYTAVGDESRFYAFKIINILCRWAVPNFFMITGYCLLLKKELSVRYCLRHAGKFVAVLFTIGLLYALLELIYGAHTFNFSTLFDGIVNVIAGQTWAHMWFVYSIIGIYLVMPVLHPFMKAEGGKNAIYLTVLMFIFTILLPAFRMVFTVGIDFPFGGYLFYVCFGAMIAVTKIKPSVMVIIGGICTALGVALVFAFGTYTLDYRDIIICILSVGVFLLFKGLKVKGNRFIAAVAGASFGIYLIHPFFINMTIKVFKIDLLAQYPYFVLPAFTAIVFLASLAVVLVLKRVPLLKKLF